MNSLMSNTDNANVVANTRRFGCTKTTQMNGSQPRSRIKCSYCNFNGHTKEICYKVVAYLPNWKRKDKGSSQTSNLRNLPKANQVSAENTSLLQTNSKSGDQIEQMQ